MQQVASAPWQLVAFFFSAVVSIPFFSTFAEFEIDAWVEHPITEFTYLLTFCSFWMTWLCTQCHVP